MKANFFFILLFCVVSMQAAQVKQDDERTINLVICNDVMGRFYPNFADWVQHDSGDASIIMDMTMALLENQLVLCTKSLWISLQNIAQIWHDFVEKSETELIKNFELKMAEYQQNKIEKLKFIVEKYEYRKEIRRQKALAVQLNAMYKELIQETTEGTDLIKKYKKAQLLVKNFKEKLYFAGIQKDYVDPVFMLFNAYLCYQIILAQDYICKKVNQFKYKTVESYYILFIPKNLIKEEQDLLKNQEDIFAIKKIFREDDALLGLSFRFLNNYDYKKQLSEEKIDKFFRAFDYFNSNNLGEKLLDALKSLTFSLKDSASLPFFNILITGHGDQDTMVAEISIELTENPAGQESSDFLKLLNFFQNSMRIKSLGISACYLGGQKIGETFDVSNQFNNANLEKISFPIIFVGSFFSPTNVSFEVQLPFIENNPKFYTDKFLYGPSDDVNTHMYQNYFKSLNQEPMNYEGAAQAFSQVFHFHNKAIEPKNISNFVSIKYPNTSWFVPMELKTDEELKHIQELGIKKLIEIQKKQIKRDELKLLKDTISSDEDSSLGEDVASEVENIKKYIQFAQKISQIEASAKPIINLDENKKIVLLQANVIGTIKVHSQSELPILLPVNHYNQNYVIEKMDASALELANINDALVKSMLPISEIEESVDIVIKELKTKTQTLKNLYAFTQRMFTTKKRIFFDEETVVAGIIYTDEKGITRIVSWPNNDYPPEILVDRSFPANKAQEFITAVEQKARLDLKSFKKVKNMLVAKQKKSTIPDRVAQSRQEFEKQIQAAKTIQQAYRKKRKAGIVDTIVSDIEQDIEKIEQVV